MGSTISMCSVCGRPDFKSCGFDRWPMNLLERLRAAVRGGPHPGS